MYELLTIVSPEASDIFTTAGSISLARKQYSQDELEYFMKDASCWDFIIERHIHFVLPADWDDDRTFIMDISPDMLVIHNKALVGIFYDSCYFAFDEPSTHTIYNSNPDCSNIGANFIGGVQYSIHYHPNGVVRYSDDQRTLHSFPRDYAGSFDIPYGVETIDIAAFFKCTQLTEVHIPGSVKTIERHAFNGCVNLQNIIMDDGVGTYGDGCFQNIKGPLSVSVPASKHYITGFDSLIISNYHISPNHERFSSIDGVVLSKDQTILYRYPRARTEEAYVVPECVTTLSENAFWYCKNLKSITLPKNLIHIDRKAIQNCTNLESIFIPPTVNKVEWNYFRGCKNLKTIYIHKSQRHFDLTNWKEKASGSLEVTDNLFLDTLNIVLYD